MARTPKQQLGDAYEKKACQLFYDNGYKIVATNYRVHRVGEIDIIAYHSLSDTLVCCEVKARSSQEYGLACEQVGKVKQQKLIQTLWHFLMNNEAYHKSDVRFDVMAIDLAVQSDEMTWIVGAFLA